MSVEYKDYYKTLGVNKSSSQDEISKAYKKLARKYHPDLNPNDKNAENKFKEMNEAYEVLKDPEKRKLYDRLGPNWQHGQDFQPPPGFENAHFNFQGGGGAGFDASGFSDFFETIFGGMGHGQSGGFGAGDYFRQGGAGPRSRRGRDAEAQIELSLEEAYRGGSKAISLQEQTPGQMPRTKTLQVTIPAGVKNGAKIRLVGQGNPGLGGGQAGDLYLKIRIAPHPTFSLDGNNVVYDLPMAPWEATLGAKIRVPTLDGDVDLSVPAGADSGQKLRLRGRGLGQGAKKGDQYVRIMIKTPKDLTDEEKALWQKLVETSSFKPRMS